MVSEEQSQYLSPFVASFSLVPTRREALVCFSENREWEEKLYKEKEEKTSERGKQRRAATCPYDQCGSDRLSGSQVKYSL